MRAMRVQAMLLSYALGVTLGVFTAAYCHCCHVRSTSRAPYAAYDISLNRYFGNPALNGNHPPDEFMDDAAFVALVQNAVKLSKPILQNVHPQLLDVWLVPYADPLIRGWPCVSRTPASRLRVTCLARPGTEFSQTELWIPHLGRYPVSSVGFGCNALFWAGIWFLGIQGVGYIMGILRKPRARRGCFEVVSIDEAEHRRVGQG